VLTFLNPSTKAAKQVTFQPNLPKYPEVGDFPGAIASEVAIDSAALPNSDAILQAFAKTAMGSTKCIAPRGDFSDQIVVTNEPGVGGLTVLIISSGPPTSAIRYTIKPDKSLELQSEPNSCN